MSADPIARGLAAQAAAAGAMVRLAADRTAQNATGGMAIGWDLAEFDTHKAFDAAVNPSRLTIPPGYRFARIEAALFVSNMTANAFPQVTLRRNGVVIAANPSYNPGIAWSAPITSGLIAVTPGQYFDLYFQCSGDTAVDFLSARSFLSLQLLR